MNIEDRLQEICDDFGFKIDTVKRVYEDLLTKDCFSNDQDIERQYDCIYKVFLEKSEITNITDQEGLKLYSSTNDYAINKGLFETYRKEAIDDLSESFLDYLTNEIDYNGRTKLENFYEEYEFYDKDEENVHTR